VDSSIVGNFSGVGRERINLWLMAVLMLAVTLASVIASKDTAGWRSCINCCCRIYT
jgi:hypothetical protein